MALTVLVLLLISVGVAVWLWESGTLDKLLVTLHLKQAPLVVKAEPSSEPLKDDKK